MNREDLPTDQIAIAVAIAIYDLKRPLHKITTDWRRIHEKFSGKLTAVADTEKMGFQRTLKFTVAVISLKFGGSLFQVAGPATEKGLSPKLSIVLDTSKEPDVEDPRVARPCNNDI